MAKIQYIRSSIQYDSPNTSSSIGKPKEETVDPSLRIVLTFGIIGVVLAVFASLLAITAVQARKDSEAELKKAFVQRINLSNSFIGRSLYPEALVNYRNAMKALIENYDEGDVSVKTYNRFASVVWEQLVSKEITRALCVTFLREAALLTETPLPEVASSLIYFENAADTEVIVGTVGSPEGDELFPVMDLQSPEKDQEEEEVETIPSYSVE